MDFEERKLALEERKLDLEERKLELEDRKLALEERKLETALEDRKLALEERKLETADLNLRSLIAKMDEIGDSEGIIDVLKASLTFNPVAHRQEDTERHSFKQRRYSVSGISRLVESFTESGFRGHVKQFADKIGLSGQVRRTTGDNASLWVQGNDDQLRALESFLIDCIQKKVFNSCVRSPIREELLLCVGFQIEKNSSSKTVKGPNSPDDWDVKSISSTASRELLGGPPSASGRTSPVNGIFKSQGNSSSRI